MTKNKIAGIPLDSRTQTYLFFNQLIKISGFNILLPKREYLGNLTKGSNLDELLLFLNNLDDNVKYLIISTDALYFGGLIQSRKDSFLESRFNLVVDTLIKLKKKGIIIYAFETIMRTSITTTNTETMNYWATINKSNYETDNEKRLSILKSIPKDILDTYYNARLEKHKSNLKTLSLVKDNIIDYLILLQEDTAPYGKQKEEQKILTEYITNNNLENKTKIYSGADEGGLVLLGKVLLELTNIKLTIDIVSSNEQLYNTYRDFEDFPCVYNVNSMKEVTSTNINTSNHITLGIYLEPNGKTMTSQNEFPKNIYNVEEFNKFKDNLINTNNEVFLSDCAIPNGGFKYVYDSIPCVGYSAWNTSTNTLGTCICNIICYQVGKVYNPNYIQDAYNYKLLRYYDDCIYQSVLRYRLVKYCSLNDINSFNLGNSHDSVLEILHGYYKEIMKEDYPKFKIDFSWNRLFELDIEYTK